MRWIGYFVLLVTELAVYDQLSNLGGPSGAFYGYFILMGMMTIIAIFFHEMGHALAVWKSGGTVHSINVSFFRYNVTERRLEAAPRSISREVGGYVVYAFEKRLGTPRKEILIASAGPAANFLTGLGAFALSLLFIPAVPVTPTPTIVAGQLQMIGADQPPLINLPSEDRVAELLDNAMAQKRLEFWRVLLASFMTLSIGLALANLVPFKGSDGAAILRNWAKPKQQFGRQ